MGKVMEVLCDLGHPPQGQCCDWPPGIWQPSGRWEDLLSPAATLEVGEGGGCLCFPE